MNNFGMEVTDVDKPIECLPGDTPCIFFGQAFDVNQGVVKIDGSAFPQWWFREPRSDWYSNSQCCKYTISVELSAIPHDDQTPL